MKLAIYSGYTGPGTHTNISYKPTGKYPAYFLTNNSSVLMQAQSLGWIPVFLEKPEPVNDYSISTAQCKLIKITPSAHSSLADYDYLYYTDDKMGIDDSRMGEFIDILGDCAYAMRDHPWNPTNILDELVESIPQPRYFNIRHKMVEYITKELNSGCSIESRLMWGSTVLRNMKHKDRLSIDNDWYESTQLGGGLQDQISFFFTAQRYRDSITNLLPMDCDRC